MIHYNILDKDRIEILPLLSSFKKDFYLAGGTGLALQIGHRDSIDFDFFSGTEFDTVLLFKKLENKFSGRNILKIQEEVGTLSIILDNKIKISFFHYPYKLIESPIEEPNINIASIADIAVMKVSAIVSRAALKDYVDLFFILDFISFDEIIRYTREKLPSLDENLIRKSVVYFEDVLQEEIMFKTDKKPSWEDVQARIKKEILKS